MRRALWITAAAAALALLIAGARLAAVAPRVHRDLERFERRVAEIERALAERPADPDDPEWVRARLAAMAEADQYAREFVNVTRAQGHHPFLGALYFELRFHALAVELERRHVRALRALLDRHGWISRPRFGATADTHAWLVAHHADVHPEFQKRVLARLEEEAARGGTDPEHYARLYDRIAVHEGRPQRYGTQGRCTDDGRWEPEPIEDRETLAERRRRYGLLPLDRRRRLESAECAGAQ